MNKYILFMFCILTSCLYSNTDSKPSKEECVVLLCNKKYFPKFLQTLDQLTTKGQYHGDICLIIGDDLVGDKLLHHHLIQRNHVIVKHFPDLPFPDTFLEIARTFPLFNKLFQYHKLHLFNVYFKQWKTILYIDCGMHIYADIRPILETQQENTLLAHSDAYPDYSWKLNCQFYKNDIAAYNQLSHDFNLDIDYFQTTTMLYDTRIIQENTFDELYQLALKYPICLTNDQGVIALYFTSVVPVWRQIPMHNQKTHFYDFHKREKHQKYIMLKSDPAKKSRFEKYVDRIAQFFR